MATIPRMSGGRRAFPSARQGVRQRVVVCWWRRKVSAGLRGALLLLVDFFGALLHKSVFGRIGKSKLITGASRENPSPNPECNANAVPGPKVEVWCVRVSRCRLTCK
jgi:hypothetical protein